MCWVLRICQTLQLLMNWPFKKQRQHRFGTEISAYWHPKIPNNIHPLRRKYYILHTEEFGNQRGEHTEVASSAVAAPTADITNRELLMTAATSGSCHKSLGKCLCLQV